MVIIIKNNRASKGTQSGRSRISACCGSDSDSKKVAVVVPVSVDGQNNACALDTKTYTVTTFPAGHYDPIEWTCPGANPQTGSGASYSPQFPRAGRYRVTASCGQSAGMDVFVGAHRDAPDSEACDPLPQLPNNSNGTIVDYIDAYRYKEAYHSLTYYWSQPIPPTPRGSCGQAVFTGAIQNNPSWSIDVNFELNWSIFGVNTSYIRHQPSQSSLSGFSAGPTQQIQYKINSWIILCNAYAERTIHEWDFERHRYRSSTDSIHDTFSATDVMSQNCIYCCGI